MTNRTAADAASDWMTAKNMETEANRLRLEAEAELIKFLGAKTEGAESHQIGPYKATITGKLNRKIDWDAFHKMDIPAQLAPVKYKPELDNKGLKYIESNEPEVFKRFCTAMTIEPAKTSVTVIRTEA